MRGHIGLVKAIEEFIASYPGARHIKNGRTPVQLQPGQEKIESELTTSSYAIPILCEGSTMSALVKIQFTYDKRTNTGHILMNSSHIELIAGKDLNSNEHKIHAIKQLYNVIREGDKRAQINMTCYKCGHVTEHECW